MTGSHESQACAHGGVGQLDQAVLAGKESLDQQKE